MTEDEAKQKRCCGPRASGLGEDIDCIASACAAWRRGEDEWQQSVDRLSGRHVPTGYCGLAGTPS